MSEGHSSASLRKRNKKKKRARGGGEDWDEEPEGVHLYQSQQNQDGGDSAGDEPQFIDPEVNYEYQPEPQIEEDIQISPKSSPKAKVERDRSANRGKLATEKLPPYEPRLNIEDDEEEDQQNNDSSVYKIIFFILFLLLSAIGTMIFVENYNNAADSISTAQDKGLGGNDASLDSIIDERVNNWEVEENTPEPEIERRVEFENFEEPLPSEDAIDEKLENPPVEEESELFNWVISTSEAFAIGLIETLENIYTTLISADLNGFYGEGVVDNTENENDALDALEEQIKPYGDEHTEHHREQADDRDVQDDITDKIEPEDFEDADHAEGFYEEHADGTDRSDDPTTNSRSIDYAEGENPRETEDSIYGYHENIASDTTDDARNDDDAEDSDEADRRDDDKTAGRNDFNKNIDARDAYHESIIVGSDGNLRDAWETDDNSGGSHGYPDVNDDNAVNSNKRNIWHDGNTGNFYDTFSNNEVDERNAYPEHIEVEDRETAQEDGNAFENDVDSNTVNNEFQNQPADNPPKEEEDTDLNNNARYYSSMGWTHQQEL